MRMEFKGSFLYFRPTWILEDDKIIIRKKVYLFSKMKKVNIYIPTNHGFSPYISFIYDNNDELIIINFSRKEPDFSKGKSAYQYVNSKIKEYEEEIQKRIEEEQEIKKQTEKAREERQKKRAIQKIEQEKLKEKYKIEQEELKEKYIAIMINRPEILKFYFRILNEKNNTNYTELRKYNSNFFKILFWDFLLGKTTKSSYSYEYDICQSKFLMEYTNDKNRYSRIIGKKLSLRFYDNEKKILKTYLYVGNFEKTEKNYSRYNFFEICNDIYKYSRIMKYLIDFYDIVDEFESNEELMQIYNNMKKGKIDREEIINKLYLLYKNLYVNSFKKKLDKNDIELVVELMSRNKILKDDNKFQYNIISKSQLTQLIYDELNGVCEENAGVKDNLKNKLVVNIKLRRDIIIKISSYLKNAKIIDKELQHDIIINIDDVLDEISKKIRKHNQIRKEQTELDQAKKEKDRLLKGNLSIELKAKRLREELELNTNKIKNGFEFEDYVANLYKKLGYRIVEVTKKSGDQGADVVAIKNDTKYVIQAKFYNSPVGNKAVQEVVASLAMYKADKGIVITNNIFTQSAIVLANANNIELVDGDKIEKYKKQILAKI